MQQLKNIGNFLLVHRRDLKLTQEYVAEKSKISTITLQKIEAGNSNYEIFSLIKLCDFYKLTIKVDS